MTRKVVIFAVLAMMALVVACGSSATTSPLNATIEVVNHVTVTSNAISNSYEGPYLPVLEQMADKIDMFKKFNEVDLELSKTAIFSGQLLKDSIQHHKYEENIILNGKNWLHGDEYQRYNYVVNQNNKILVAQWIPRDNIEPISIDEIAKACKKPSEAAVVAFKNTGRFMVNFYPEEPLIKGTEVKFCHDDADGKRKLLDELTKHFMMAQDTANQAVKNNEFDEKIGFDDSWQATEIAYAGEIIVDVRICQYTITNGSGTYTPNPKYLRDVADLFGKIEGIDAPAYQEDNGPLGKGPRKSSANKGQLPEEFCKTDS